VAVIKVGAATEGELKEKKHRIEDAVSAKEAQDKVDLGGDELNWPLTAFRPHPGSSRRTLADRRERRL